MISWFDNPVFQSALLPFAMALISGTFAYRWLRRLTPACVLIGYTAAFVSILGVTGLALNTITRLALFALLGFLVFMVAELAKIGPRRSYAIALLTLLLGLGFVFYGIFKNMQLGALITWLGIALAYGAMILFGLLTQNKNIVQQYSSVWVLCITTGFMAFVAGSGLVMQLNFALSAAIGAWLLILVFGHSQRGYLVYPVIGTVALLTALMAIDMVVREEDAWVLLPLVLIVWLVKFIPIRSSIPWQQALWALLMALPGSGVTLAWLWWTGDTSMGY